MVVWSGTPSSSPSPPTIRTAYQHLCEPEPDDSRPKGGRTRRSAVVWNRSTGVRGTELHVPCRRPGRAGRPPGRRSRSWSTAEQGQALLRWVPSHQGQRAGVNGQPRAERGAVMEPSWVRRRRCGAIPWGRPGATFDIRLRRSQTVSTQSKMRSSWSGWPLGEHPATREGDAHG
jgi:hypothetical protein